MLNGLSRQEATRKDAMLTERIGRLLKERDEIMKAVDVGTYALYACAFTRYAQVCSSAQAEAKVDHMVGPTCIST